MFGSWVGWLVTGCIGGQSTHVEQSLKHKTKVERTCDGQKGRGEQDKKIMKKQKQGRGPNKQENLSSTPRVYQS